mgnify:CR=1 FL=1
MNWGGFCADSKAVFVCRMGKYGFECNEHHGECEQLYEYIGCLCKWLELFDDGGLLNESFIQKKE